MQIRQKIINIKKGYISAPWINQLIDPLLQGFAADLIAEHFSGSDITKIVPIPNMGIPLGTAVAERLEIPLAPGRKDDHVPGAWRKPYVIKEETPSFTTGALSSFTFNEIGPGDRILLIDDFCALGATGVAISSRFQRDKMEVRYGVYCAKLFQGGLERIRRLNIDSFYAVGIADINGGEIHLSSAHHE